MRKSQLAGSAFALVLGLSASPGHAIQPQAEVDTRPAIELYQASAGSPRSAASRGTIDWDQPPGRLVEPFRLFRAEFGEGWRAGFDRVRRVPSRLFGPGVHVPNAVSDGDVAVAHARNVLERHMALLSPGAKPSDFELVANDLDAGIRSIGFRQTKNGRTVSGGQVSFRYKNDRLYVIGSEAYAHVPDLSSAPVVSADEAKKAALSWVTSDFGSSVAGEPSAELIVPYRDARGALRFARAVLVEVSTSEITGKYSVAVDLISGQPVLRRSLLHFASAPVLFRVPLRSPTFGERIDLPAVLANVNVEGASAQTNVNGTVTWATGPSTEVELFLTGPRVRIFNDAGAEATLLTTLNDASPFVWDESQDPALDAQLTTFIHAERVRTFAKGFAPNLGFLNNQISATVNIAEQCNAFSDGTTINFYSLGGGCENTGRIADVVYHEYGHSIHAHAIIEGVGAFDGALSEGISDYLAATITGDPATARGFFLNSSPLRHLDPNGQENRWPEDLVGEVHEDGLVIGQALWDLRKNLIDSLGASEGAATSDELHYQAIRRATDIPTMYVEVLAADDDDGDVTNGTPNVCAINEAFNRHGLQAIGTKTSSLGATGVSEQGFEVAVELTGLFPECPGESIVGGTLSFRDRAGSALEGSEAMTLSGTKLVGMLPSVPENTVLKYRVEVELEDRTLAFPDNAADPEYEMFVGTVVPLYCTTFETDPADDGWVHGLLEGEDIEGADDWVWAEPNGTIINGDPPLAYSGDKAFGNDLSVESNYNGLYQPEKTNFASSPVVDLQGYTNIHLQYRRWLNVEDGHFDQAQILVGEEPVWQNLDSEDGSDSNTHHRDKEWRFQDVDLSEKLAGLSSGQVHFVLSSDQGLEMGGWTIDDVCLVALEGPPVDPCAATGAGGGCEGGSGSGAGDSGGSSSGSGAGGENQDEDSGCDCRSSTSQSNDRGWMALAAIGLATMVRRRRRSS